MRDALVTTRNYLLTKSALTAITGTGSRLIAARDLPPGYTPSDGSALIFMTQPGSQDYTSGMLMPRIQFRSYGGFAKGEKHTEGEANAWLLDQVLYESVNDTSYEAGNIAQFRLEDGTYPTMLTEPGSDWPYVLTFYRAYIRND